MKRLSNILLFVFALALVVQNTCPYGIAGKTAVAAAAGHHCPLKSSEPVNDEGKDAAQVTVFPTAGAGPSFVLQDQSLRVVANVPLPESSLPVAKDRYTPEVFLSPPLRPPSA